MFGSLIVCYLFLGGAGAGACLVSCALSLFSPGEFVSQWRPNHRGTPRRIASLSAAHNRLLLPSLVVGLVVLGIGVVCLVVDVGRVDRIMLLFTNPTKSYIALGTWLLASCLLVGVLLTSAWSGLLSVPYWVARAFEGLLAVASCFVMLYTGLLLQSVSSIPLWSSFWLPALFVASSLSCGIAIVLAVGQFSGAGALFSRVFARLALADVFVIVIEAVVVVFYLLAVTGVLDIGAPGFAATSGTGETLAASANELLCGSKAWLFWVLFCFLGMVCVAVLDGVLFWLQSKHVPLLGLATASCVLVGGFVMRYCIVEAALHTSSWMTYAL